MIASWFRPRRPARLTRSLGALARDRGGVSTILFAASMLGIAGASALAMDVASMYLAQRKLQGVADAAAMAAANSDLTASPNTVAQGVISVSGVDRVGISSLVTGTYQRDKAIAPANRFSPSGSAPNAVQITLTQKVPLIFGGLLSGTSMATVNAKATAARADVVAFSLGTHLLSFSNGIAGSLLSALAGTALGLSNSDIATLTSTSINVSSFADALRQQVGQGNATFGSVFSARQKLSDVIAAMAAAAPDAQSARVLSGIASKVNHNVTMSDIIDLGQFGQTDVNNGNLTASVDAFSLLRAILQGNDGAPATVVLGVNVPGVANVSITVATGPGVVHSPWLTIDSARNYMLRTAQSRILLSVATTTAGLSGVASLNIPIYLEIASAQARLTSTACTGNSSSDGATIGATPSIGTAAIAQVDMSRFSDMSAPLALQPAALVNVLGLKVNAYSSIALGGVNEQSVWFSRSDIDNHVIHEIATNDLVQGVTASLVSKVQISATTPLGTVNAGPVVSAVGSQLQVLAPPLDSLINELTQALGIKLGVADLTVDQLRCGVPNLM